MESNSGNVDVATNNDQMNSAVVPPEGTPKVSQLSAYLRCHNAAAAIYFYKEIFGAVEMMRLTEPSERVAHAELRLGTAKLLVCDECPEEGMMSPTSLDGTGVGLYMQVDNVNVVFAAAVARGAMSLSEPRDQFYGERTAKIRDPWGHEWLLSQQLETLSAVEMQERFESLMSEDSGTETEG